MCICVYLYNASTDIYHNEIFYLDTLYRNGSGSNKKWSRRKRETEARQRRQAWGGTSETKRIFGDNYFNPPSSHAAVWCCSIIDELLKLIFSILQKPKAHTNTFQNEHFWYVNMHVYVGENIGRFHFAACYMSRHIASHHNNFIYSHVYSSICS